MPFSGNGAGTQNDPYQIETVTHVNEIEAGGFYYEFQNDVDYGGNAISRITSFDSFIDLNGFTLSNVDLDSNVWLRDMSGGIENGTIHCAVSNSIKASLFDFDGGYGRKLKITGSITSTGDHASGLSEFIASGSTIEDIIILADISGATRANGVVDNAQVLTANRIVFTGTLTDNSGSASLYGLTNNGSITFADSFWNTTLNPSATSSEGTGKTTTELQTLSTYNDTATTGLDTVWDIESLSTHDGEEATALWGIDDGNAYPVLYFEIEGVTQPISGTIEDEQGNPVQNAIVKIFTESSLEDQTAPTFVEAVITDANGDWAMQAAYDETLSYKVEYKYFKAEYTGTATGGTTSSLTHTGTFTAGEFDDGQAVIKITAGTNSGEERRITGNADTDTVDIDGTFLSAIDNTSEYEIGYMYSDELKFKPPKASA